ncbi:MULTISPECIES: methyl-accepting chemotaxis protein [unclassified Pseudoalteromonas]|uniref:methyl-accepting chemotaxis protein n=1 Tax=unclassified Pseudoalteromonas TaxID=194690 RepID=UPI0005A8F667|nr:MULTISPECIES: methyl-accepting chemotaxis protein [unclassified Pseudoalteromonas]
MNSITQKMLMALVSSTLLVLVLVSLTSYMVQKNSEINYWQDNTQVLNEQLKVILLEPVFAYDKPLIKSILEAIIKDTSVASVSVFDQRNKALGEVKSANSDTDESVTLPLIWEDKSQIGSVKIDYSQQGVMAKLNQAIVEKSLVLITTLILLSLVLTYFLRKIIIAPLLNLSGVLADIAQGGGDLTQRIPKKYDDEIGGLAVNFNNFINTVQSIVSSLAGANKELENVATRVESVSDTTNKDLHEQRSQTKDSLEHLTQLQTATLDIAKNAEQTSINTNNVQKLSQQGKVLMESNLTKVDELVEELDNTAKVVTQLRSETQNITQVLDVIKGIAEQTNLLALNAAIEAARAGESGRGFSVVADEVRALASKTQDSTNEIEQMIISLQKQAQTSFEATHRSKELVTHTIESTRSANSSLNEINDKIEEVNEMNTLIASACEEQSSVTLGVKGGMEKVDMGAQQLSHEANVLHTATAELSEVQQKLVRQITRFTY